MGSEFFFVGFMTKITLTPFSGQEAADFGEGGVNRGQRGAPSLIFAKAAKKNSDPDLPRLHLGCCYTPYGIQMFLT
jgi:hypothetical protein